MTSLGQLFFGYVIVAMAASTLAATMGGESVRFRLASLSRHELALVRVDNGIMYLRPEDSNRGEVIVPLHEAPELQLVLPESYGRARQAAFHGRRGEAIETLAPLVEALLPLAGWPQTQAGPVVVFHLELLLDERRWEEADRLIRRLGTEPPPIFQPLIRRLVRGWVGERQSGAAVTFLGRLSWSDDGVVQLVEDVVDELRRREAWAEAQVLLERLVARPDEATRRRQLLLAFCELKLHQWVRAAARWQAWEAAEGGDAEVLRLLVQGQLALRADRVEEALDVLARALVAGGARSEWDAELNRGLAAAYRQRGQPEIAATIEATAADPALATVLTAPAGSTTGQVE
jgi:hypothetical protein